MTGMARFFDSKDREGGPLVTGRVGPSCKRDKRTRLRCHPVETFQALALDCDGRHVHRRGASTRRRASLRLPRSVFILGCCVNAWARAHSQRSPPATDVTNFSMSPSWRQVSRMGRLVRQCCRCRSGLRHRVLKALSIRMSACSRARLSRRSPEVPSFPTWYQCSRAVTSSLYSRLMRTACRSMSGEFSMMTCA